MQALRKVSQGILHRQLWHEGEEREMSAMHATEAIFKQSFDAGVVRDLEILRRQIRRSARRMRHGRRVRFVILLFVRSAFQQQVVRASKL